MCVYLKETELELNKQKNSRIHANKSKVIFWKLSFLLVRYVVLLYWKERIPSHNNQDMMTTTKRNMSKDKYLQFENDISSTKV